VLEFAVPHTLAFTFFPAWLNGLRQDFGALKSRLIALNVHDAVLRMVEGSCDVLIAYHHSALPIQLDANRYEMVSLGHELIAPYVRPNEQGSPLHALPGQPKAALPYLGYAPGAYMGQMVDLILKQSAVPIHFDRVYETDMAEGLKAMALEGHGIAFLPYSAVRKDLGAGRLVRAEGAELLAANPRGLELTMDIRAYREAPREGAREHARGEAHQRNVQALWDHLVQRSGTAAAGQ
jgi:DNA-binding transcriptional LysR family regulator